MLKQLKILVALVPAATVFLAVLDSRIGLHQQFGEWFLPQVWMIDLTVWLLAPLVYCLPKSQKDTWQANLRMVYWIAFFVLSLFYGVVLVFTAWEVFAL